MVAAPGARINVTADTRINHLVRAIESAPGSSVVLVVRGSAPVLEAAANVKLLQFYAERSGKELRVDTDQPQLRAFLAEYGIRSAEDAAEIPREPVAVKPRGFRPRWYHLAAVPLLIIGLGYLAYYAPEPVRITIVPQVRPFSDEFLVPLADLATTELKVSFTVTDELAASGRTSEPLAAARGSVVLINDTPQAVKVPKGTLVATAGGQTFATLDAVTVPARVTEYFHEIPVGIRAGQAEVRVEAVEKGTHGNIAAHRIVNVVGFAELKAVNPEPITGGRDRELTVVTQADHDLLRERLEKLAAGRAESELNLVVPTDQIVLAPLLSWDLSDVQLQPDPGQQAGIVQGKAVVTAVAPCVAAEVLAQQAGRLVETQLQPLPMQVNNLAVQVKTVLAEGIVCQVSGQLVSHISTGELAALIAGRPINQAISLLSAQPGVESFEIDAGKRNKLPRNQQYIQVQVISEPEVVALQ